MVIETMGFPRGDCYQIISEHKPWWLEYQAPNTDRLMTHPIMRAGRADEANTPSTSG